MHEKDQAGDSAGQLSESEQRVAEERTALRAAVIHEAIRTEGEAELRRPVSALFWSGMAAGLSMGFSLAAMGLIQSCLLPAREDPAEQHGRESSFYGKLGHFRDRRSNLGAKDPGSAHHGSDHPGAEHVRDEHHAPHAEHGPEGFPIAAGKQRQHHC